MFAGWTLGAAMATALQRAGGELATGPGLPIRMRQGEDTFDPVNVAPNIAQEEKTVEDVIQEMERLGIADLELRTESEAQTADRSVEIHGV